MGTFLQLSFFGIPILSSLLLQPEEGEEGQLKRPEVSEEDLIGAKDKLSSKGKLKGKTIEVMDECGEQCHFYWHDNRVRATFPKLGAILVLLP